MTTVVNPAEMAKQAKDLALKPSVPLTLNTASGPCIIFGSHLVHPKLIGILGMMLNLPEWVDGKIPGPGINSIVFRGDGMPCKPDGNAVFGMSQGDAGAIAINLRHHWNRALNTAIVVEPTLSVRATLWHELITTIAHEIHHTAVTNALSPDEVWTAEDYAAEEEMAIEWAQEQVLELATSPETCDAEPAPFSEEPFFGFLFMKANVERVAAGDDEETWNHQLEMLAKDIAWRDPSDGMTCKSWSDWVLANTDEVTKTMVEAADINNAVEVMEVKIMDKATGEVIPDEPVATVGEIVPVTSAITLKANTKKEMLLQVAAAAGVALAINNTEAGAEITPEVTLESLFPGEVGKENANLFGTGDPADAMVLDDEVMSLIHDNTEDPNNPVVIETTLPPNAPAVTGNEASEQPTFIATEPPITERQAFDVAKVNTTAEILYQRLFTHIFTKCGFLNGSFENPTAVFEAVPITDIPGIDILVGMDTINQHGQLKKKTPVQGFVMGHIFQQKKLPTYHIYLNIGGVIHERRILPQNPNTGSKPAQEALAGNHKGYIIDSVETDRGKSFKLWYTNGQLTPCT